MRIASSARRVPPTAGDLLGHVAAVEAEHVREVVAGAGGDHPERRGRAHELLDREVHEAVTAHEQHTGCRRW